MVDINFPSDSDHLAIIGRNGSGKTIAAGFNFSMRSWDRMPWAIINSKRDALIEKISKLDGVNNVKLDYTPAKRAKGIYVYRPLPEKDDEALNDLLWRIHSRGKCGIWIDEGYMMPGGGAFNAILTQGRSLKIPLITLIQRPVFVSKFVTTESNFIQLFDLTHSDDKHHIRKFMPYDAVETLPPYHSLWYDVKAKHLTPFAPVPREDEILETIRQRITPQVHYL